MHPHWRRGPVLLLMQRPIPWLWITLAAGLLLAPGLVGRLFVDVLEGFTLLLVLGPLLLAGAGLLGWQLLKRRLVTCPACGTPSFGAVVCPACGAALVDPGSKPEGAARDAVIDVQVSEVRDDG